MLKRNSIVKEDEEKLEGKKKTKFSILNIFIFVNKD